MFYWFDIIVNMAFTAEMVMRILSMGFVVGKDTYLRDSWNLLDFTIVTSSWLSVFAEMHGGHGANVSSFRALRVMRPLRQLRTMRYIAVTRAIIECLAASWANLGPVLGLYFLIFCIFGTIGMPSFQGLLSRKCVNASYFYNESALLALDATNTTPVFPASAVEAVCPETIECAADEMCVKRDLYWTHGLMVHDSATIRDHSGFDSIFMSFQTLMMAISLDGNTFQIPWQLADTNSDSGWLIWPYYMTLVLFVCFWAGHLFGAVVTATFRRVNKVDRVLDYRVGKQEETNLVARATRATDHAAAAKILGAINLVERKVLNPTKKLGAAATGGVLMKFQDLCSAVAQHPKFSPFIMIIVVVNVTAMAAEYDGQPESYVEKVDMVNNACTVIYFLELIVKVTSFGFFGYIKEPINIMDALICLTALMTW